MGTLDPFLRRARQQAEGRVGQVINGKFHVREFIGMGAAACVFSATHRNGRRVALKMLHAHYGSDPSTRVRFIREGYIANKVVHRGAVPVLDDGVSEDGAPFMVMELLDGNSLGTWLSRLQGSPLEPIDALVIADQLLDVLDAYHQRGVIHRDIKPSNLFLTYGGTVKILDFGLARIREMWSDELTPVSAGTVIGTTAYMSPEQAMGTGVELDERADLFAVGAVLFHAMSGRYAVAGSTPIERLQNAMTVEAPPLRKYLPSAPSYVARIVDTALAFDRRDRWRSAFEMRRSVRAAYDALAEASCTSGQDRAWGGTDGTMHTRPRLQLELLEEDLELDSAILLDDADLEMATPSEASFSKAPTIRQLGVEGPPSRARSPDPFDGSTSGSSVH